LGSASRRWSDFFAVTGTLSTVTTSTLTANGTSTFNSTATFSGPTTFSGTTTLNGTPQFGSAPRPTTDVGQTLGTGANRWSTLHLGNGGSGAINCYGLCDPVNDNTDDWGSAGKRWESVYGVNARFNAYFFNGSTGGSSTVTVRNSAGTGTCTITFTVGGFISTTC
jgi:hypothetical protein